MSNTALLRQRLKRLEVGLREPQSDLLGSGRTNLPVELLQRDAAPLTAVGAGEELGAAGGEPPHARVAERADGVVDEVEIEIDPAAERVLGERDRGLEIRVAGGGGQHEPEFFLREIHVGASVAS